MDLDVRYNVFFFPRTERSHLMRGIDGWTLAGA